ncbi:MAG: hypothetical protein NDJ92_12615, partial [Thermoanaerobaculia bacterium]|nr:hypothetical protein [Thermoanaerobaculia bacterium]
MPMPARRLVIGVVIALAALVAGLVLVVLREPRSEEIGSCERCLELARLAPADSDEVVIVPKGGSLWFAAARHPVREDRIFGGGVRGTLVALAVGRNPVVLWKQGDRTGGAVSAPAARRWLIALALPAKFRGQVWTKAGALVSGSSAGGFPIDALAALAQEPGQLFVAHRKRPSIPGVIAPALSSLTL